jgi:hypothetical protein
MAVAQTTTIMRRVTMGTQDEQVEKPTHPFTKDEPLTDLALVVEDERIYVSKAFLSMASPVFRRMFESDFNEKTAQEIPLPGKKLADVINFLHTIHPAMMRPITGIIWRSLAYYSTFIDKCA